jgi:cold shock CspA family protein
MASTGTSVGTVIRWDEEAGGAIIEVPDLPGDCWAEASVVARDTATGTLRAGQVVAVEWTEPGAGGLPFRAVRVQQREDLQSTPGG